MVADAKLIPFQDRRKQFLRRRFATARQIRFTRPPAPFIFAQTKNES
jgi:hypothetical protein